MQLKKAWSHSALNAFETCPRRFYLTRVAKKVKEPQHEALLWGNQVHKALENYAKSMKPLPQDLQKYRQYVDKFFSRDGKRIIEMQMCINRNMKPTGWFAKDAWCRGVIDIGVVSSDTAYLLDWKTGKVKPDLDQMKLFAALASIYYPYVEKFVTGFVWLKFGKFTKEVFTKDDIPSIWEEFAPRLKRMAVAYEKDRWVAKPSGLCREWCPVGRDNCEHCGV